jgi:hypothetical protein
VGDKLFYQRQWAMKAEASMEPTKHTLIKWDRVIAIVEVGTDVPVGTTGVIWDVDDRDIYTPFAVDFGGGDKCYWCGYDHIKAVSNPKPEA